MVQNALFNAYFESICRRVQAEQYRRVLAALKERWCIPLHLSASQFVSEGITTVMAITSAQGEPEPGPREASSTSLPAALCEPRLARRVSGNREQGRPHPHLPTGQAQRSAPLSSSLQHSPRGRPRADSAFPSVNWDVYLTSNSGQRRSCLGSPALNSHISVFKFFNHSLRGTLLSNSAFPSFLLLCQCPKFRIEHSIPLNVLSVACRLSTCHYMLFRLDSNVRLNFTAHKEEKQLQHST